jgi:hypothetical protein
MAFPINGSTTYASWTIPSSTITNGIFVFGGATGITYNAYTALTPVDAQSLATVAITIKPATRAVNNGPVYDVLKANGFTTSGQSGSSTITFALSLSCGVLTVDTTAPGVIGALGALAAPQGYETTTATSTGANGATTAALLGYRGSVANINIVLPWISYNKTAGTACTSLPVFQAAIWDAQSTSTPVAWNFTDNGHYYQYVNTNSTWDVAYQAITGQSANYPYAMPATRANASCIYSVFNLCGYFATVQTGPENAFITTKTGGSAAWLGGNDRGTQAVNKAFKWADPKAPEFNEIFSTYTKSGGAGWGVGTNIASSYTVNGTTYLYENWNDGEPNDYNNGNPGETALQILAGGAGNWNDLPENSSSLPYVVEYGGISGETAIAAGSRTSAITWHW